MPGLISAIILERAFPKGPFLDDGWLTNLHINMLRWKSLIFIKKIASLQEKPAVLKWEHPALQNMKILNFFLFLWVIFALLDPNPDLDPPLAWLTPDPIRIRKSTSRYGKPQCCGSGSGVGSEVGTFCRIRSRIRNKSFRIRIRPIRIRNEFYT